MSDAVAIDRQIGVESKKFPDNFNRHGLGIAQFGCRTSGSQWHGVPIDTIINDAKHCDNKSVHIHSISLPSPVGGFLYSTFDIPDVSSFNVPAGADVNGKGQNRLNSGDGKWTISVAEDQRSDNANNNNKIFLLDGGVNVFRLGVAADLLETTASASGGVEDIGAEDITLILGTTDMTEADDEFAVRFEAFDTLGASGITATGGRMTITGAASAIANDNLLINGLPAGSGNLTYTAIASRDATLSPDAGNVTVGGQNVILDESTDPNNPTGAVTIDNAATATVSATANDAGARITGINAVRVGAGVAPTVGALAGTAPGPFTSELSGLSTGDYTITIVVTAASGATRSYAITLTVAPLPPPPTRRSPPSR